MATKRLMGGWCIQYEYAGQRDDWHPGKISSCYSAVLNLNFINYLFVEFAFNVLGSHLIR